MASPTETTPLVGDGPAPHGPEHVAKPYSRRTVALLSFTILCMAGSGALCTVPVVKLLENVLCRRYYATDDDIDERLCKVDAVQSELAYLLGIMSSLEAVIGLVVALPYGVLADKIGRRLVFVLSAAGTVSSLLWVLTVLRFWRHIPVYLIWLSPAFQVIGGGNSVLLAMNYSIVADAVTDATRASAFFRMAVASYVGGVAGALASARLMQVSSPWTPILISLVVVILGLSVIIFVPETLHVKRHQPTGGVTEQSKSLASRLRRYAMKSLVRLSDSLSMLKTPSTVLILFVFFCQAPVILTAGQFMVQYVSKRFGWSLAQGGYLLSVRGVTSMLVLLAGLPALENILTSPSMSFSPSPSRKDLVLAQFSGLFVALGALLMAGSTIYVFVTGYIVLTLGDGLMALSRSLITSFVDEEHTSTLYTLISMTETTGTLCAGPAVAGLFSAGMKLGGGWSGLPYLGLASLGTLVTAFLLMVRLPQSRHDELPTDGETGEPN